MRNFKIYFLRNFQICNTVLLTSHHDVHYIPMAYLFYNWNFVPFDPLLHPFLQSLIPCLCNHKSLFCIYKFGIFKKIPHINEITWYLSFSVWLISLSIMPSRSIHIFTMARFPSSYGWVIFHCMCACVCMCTPHLLYPFIYQRTLRLLPYLGYY